MGRCVMTELSEEVTLEEDFDFVQDKLDEIEEKIKGSKEKEEEEIATSGSPPFGTLTPEIIAEARKANGLDIAKFYKKYGLSLPVERLLLGPLDEEGNLA